MLPWNPPPETLTLNAHEVHIWRASLDLPQAQLSSLEQLLAGDERARAQRFRFLRDRSHFIAARGILRGILGRYLSRDPRTLRFSYSANGKPALLEEPGSSGLSFNLSHSQGLALYAVTPQWDIGIDVEYMKRDIEWASLAAHFFSPYEANMLHTVPPDKQIRAFYSCWTRKEAYVKARGTGLSQDLSLFDVTVTPGGPAALVAIREEGQDVSSWSLYDLPPGNDYTGAVAIEGHPKLLHCWEWHFSSFGE